MLKNGESKRNWFGIIATIYIFVLQYIYFSYLRNEFTPKWVWELIMLFSITMFIGGWYIACRFLFQYTSVSDEDNRLPKINL